MLFYDVVILIFTLSFFSLIFFIQVVRFESVTERERSISRLSLGRSPTKMPTQLIHPADDDDSGLIFFLISALKFEFV